MTRQERFALTSLFVVAAVGHLIRIAAMGPSDAPGGMTLLAGLTPGNPAVHRAQSAKLGRPLGPTEKIDVNSASAEEIARLPRVGPGMARSVVEARKARGGFLGPDELQEVRGIGPALWAAIEPHVSFGDTLKIRGRRGYVVAPTTPHPPLLVGGAPEPPKGKRSGGPPVRINSATQAELERLPGIGPTRAKAIVAYRQSHGPFAAVSDLEKVPGLSRRVVAQLASQVAAP